MIKEIVRLPALVFLGLLFLSGCASTPPTIAHTHIGHAVTGWLDTPGKEGFLSTAENAAQIALQAAEGVTRAGNDSNGIKSGVTKIVEATNPGSISERTTDTGMKYGVRNALNQAVNHISFAAASRDASTNIRSSSKTIARHAGTVLDRCDLITVLGNEILESSSVDETRLLANELANLARANVYGDDSNSDGVPGSSPEEYGLMQLRSEVQAMIDREDPPYTTVESWYLFNLVKMPSGIWIFKRPSSGGASSGSSY